MPHPAPARKPAPKSALVAWSRDSGDGFVPASARSAMSRPGIPARTSGWHTDPAHGVPLCVVVANPRGVSPRYYARMLEHTARIVGWIDGHCSTGAPERPSSLLVTYFAWGGKKRLPDAEGDACTCEHMNTGMCTRYASDGRCEIIVYRTEDALKTVIHEVLHAYGVCDWCDEDRPVRAKARAWLDAATGGGSEIADLKVAEAYVDALALYVYGAMYGVDRKTVTAASEKVARRMSRHFRAGPWRQTTAAFEYTILRHALIGKWDGITSAFSRGLQRPDKRAARALLDDPRAVPPAVEPGRSLALGLPPPP